MPKFILRFLALSTLCTAAAFGQQGTFGQIVYGGSWQTTFTLINLNSITPATVTLSFFGDNGSPLNAPVQGFGVTSAYTFAIPAGGAQNVVLSSSDQATTQGWASMSATGGTVRGQGSFRVLLPKGGISEAAVPLTLPGSALCIVPFPQSNPVILIPFDNTAGQYVTSLALANATNSTQAYVIEFDDQLNNPLVADTLPLTPMQHMAFVSTDRYPALAGKKGILRIHADPANLAVLGLLSNLTSTGAITTIIPVPQ
ncbi:MAG TPA: hypothetical protein VFC37_06735 [Terracidiphilus sp.]|nr:hypothetical protein [Terracidiphilus sp.]